MKIYRDILPHFVTFDRINDLINWEQHTGKVGGREFLEPRLTQYYGDLSYTYSGNLRVGKPFSIPLIEIKSHVEKTSGVLFNSCLANLYRDGNDSIGMHKDNEKELGENPVVATLSIGATRKFWYIDDEDGLKTGINLYHGDLIVMNGWTPHEIRKEKTKLPRISLTFRHIRGNILNEEN